MRPASRVACRWRVVEVGRNGDDGLGRVAGPAADLARGSVRTVLPACARGRRCGPCSTFRPPSASRSTIWCGMSGSSCFRSASVRPMSRLTLKMVCSGSLRPGRRAAVPTSTVPSSWKEMTTWHEGDAGCVADDDRPAVTHVRGEAEGGAQVDADDGGGWHVIRSIPRVVPTKSNVRMWPRRNRGRSGRQRADWQARSSDEMDSRHGFAKSGKLPQEILRRSRQSRRRDGRHLDAIDVSRIISARSQSSPALAASVGAGINEQVATQPMPVGPPSRAGNQ